MEIDDIVDNTHPDEGISSFYEEKLKPFCSISKTRKYIKKKNKDQEQEDMVLLLSIKELHQKLNIVSLGSKVMYHASKKTLLLDIRVLFKLLLRIS